MGDYLHPSRFPGENADMFKQSVILPVALAEWFRKEAARRNAAAIPIARDEFLPSRPVTVSDLLREAAYNYRQITEAARQPETSGGARRLKQRA